MPIQTDPPRPARETLPTMYDLPSEEIGDAGLPDEYHVRQAILLDETFRPPAAPTDEVFSAMDLNLYYDVRHPLWYKRPDWFGVIGVPRLYEGRESRLSYVVWQEGVDPLIVVELLSPGTEKEDLGQRLRDANKPPTKWEVYEQILRVPYYAVFGREANELRIFQLSGMRYVEVTGHDGRFWIEEAGLGLGLWQGSYHGQERWWLRWFDAQGNWIPTTDERITRERLRAEQERLRAEQERQQKEAALLREAQLRQRAEQAEQAAEQERQRAERLAELLRQLGQDLE
ncbi:MAG: Uma2 family endonuclease [Blastocatellia bacterium]